jgi:TolB protein
MTAERAEERSRSDRGAHRSRTSPALLILALATCVLTVRALSAHDEKRFERLTTDGLAKQRPVWSADGKSLTFTRHETGGTHIWQYIMDPASPSTPRRLTNRESPEENGTFSPDGKRILLTTIQLSGTQGNLDISIIGVDGKELKTIAGDVEGKLSHQDWPSWSPDANQFAFCSSHDGNDEIYVANIDGSNVTRLTQSAGRDSHPCWSPDGSRIAFATDRWGGLEIATVRPDGTGLVRVTQSPGLDDYPAISPDGKRIAFVSNRDSQYEIYVAGIDGSNPENISRHPLRDTYPSWTPDGRGITFVSTRDGGGDLYTLRLGP